MKTASIIVALASAATNKSVVTAIDVSSPAVVVATAIGEDASSSASSTLGSGSSGGTIRAASSSIVTKTNNNNNNNAAAATPTAEQKQLPPSFQQRVTNIGIASYESSKRVERSKRHTEANDRIRHGVLSSSQRGGVSGDSGSSAMLKKKSTISIVMKITICRVHRLQRAWRLQKVYPENSMIT